MQYLGFFLLVVFVGQHHSHLGLLQMAKGKKLLAAPFRRTAEAASNPQAAGPAGTISVEGNIVCQQPLRGPQSGQPCVYFDHKLEQEHTKASLTEDGAKTSKEWRVVSHHKQGAPFWLDDGSGPVAVHITDGVDADLHQSFSGMPGTGSGGGVGAAALGLAVAAMGEGRLRATERIIHAQGRLFALGKVQGGYITKTDGMMGKLILSTRGREGLLGTTKRNQIIAVFVVAGLAFVSGVPLAIFGSAPVSDECPSAGLKDLQLKACRGHISDDSGLTLKWTVSKEGDYAVNVTQPSVKYPIWPRMTLSSATGDRIAQVKGRGKGENADLKQHLKAGTYSINVRDDVDGYAAPFKKRAEAWSFCRHSDDAPQGARPECERDRRGCRAHGGRWPCGGERQAEGWDAEEEVVDSQSNAGNRARTSLAHRACSSNTSPDRSEVMARRRNGCCGWAKSSVTRSAV